MGAGVMLSGRIRAGKMIFAFLFGTIAHTEAASVVRLMAMEGTEPRSTVNKD